MAGKFKAGEATEWNSHGNMGRGKVRKKLTARTLIKGHAVADLDASEPLEADDTADAGAAPREARSRPAGERHP